MALSIYNTLTGTQDELVPGGVRKERIEDYPPVTIYSCGPTVYSYSHIGNFRTFIFNDLLRRYLKFRGYKVNHAMNITDVEDKIIAGANSEGISLQEYTGRYTAIFLEDLKCLNIEPVEHMPKATESIDAMIDIIENLRAKGYVYEKDGSLYFSIAKFHKYGRLSRLDTREIKTGLRYDTDEYTKDDVRDFALWKAPKENEIYWETPFGKGRPGWHIECSAMIRKIFGTTIDIHTGGVDLVFPHHENEIAQSEAAYDERFVRHWIHAEHLLVNGTKMSKSLGNFYTLRDLLDKGYSPRSIRYLLVSAHYRKQFNFTLEGIGQADQALERIDNLIVRLKDIHQDGGTSPDAVKLAEEMIAGFTEAVDDDLNISRGLGVFFEFLHRVNTMINEERLSRSDADMIMGVLKKIDSVLGVIFYARPAKTDIDASWVESMIAERIQAKKDRNFKRADEIRAELTEKGIVLEDTKEGTRWKIKS
ncbi:MAG TPA: cysteine--tRNA ligase [Spirochaetota bacterium]|nr:cysteine--tRNA ligase [Spirochaetota bacterium]HPC42066.1 cysteine--tRNA ligase [Spirochaetota bacterium]HPL15986.1 cysteine--tRNA ligase [Spirochaetota bacterium]HQF09020.1 cysteine--tRNA ligase [Spirochaetota bacterium]HQH97908.1 cysteine--tRNA ligase [Spirochaetota bacterium]